jgi:hypothetical protein
METEIRLPDLLIETVTLETTIAEDRPDIPGEINLGSRQNRDENEHGDTVCRPKKVSEFPWHQDKLQEDRLVTTAAQVTEKSE